MKPTITVVVDTYNHERFIEEAIRSVLAQDFPREQMEILVVDDGSTDCTAEIVRQFEPQVQLLTKSNGGQASAINFGVAHASGEFVAFLDGDDVWLPSKLSRVMKEFCRDPKLVMVYNLYCFWDVRDGRTWLPDFPQISGHVPADWRKLLEYSAAPTSSLVFRKSALEKLLPVPESCSFMHDAYLITTVSFLGPVGVVPECVTKNRVHGSNLWFAEAAPGPEVLRRRVAARAEAITAMRRWLRTNGPRRLRTQAKLFLCRWQLIQDAEEFRLAPPNRVRAFRHSLSHAQTLRPYISREALMYKYAHAAAVLLVGRHARYLEGVRTRLKRFKARLRHQSAKTTSTEGVGQT